MAHTTDDQRPWNRRVLRTINEQILLDQMRAAGATSRAELARVTGLSKPTVSTALGHLERAGLVRETGEQTSGRGRSAVLYEADPTAGYVVGVDVGRSWIRVALADLDGRITGRRDLPNAYGDADAMVHAAAATAGELVAGAGLDPARVLHTVVGCPGVIDPQTREMRYAGNLPGWESPGLLERMADSLGPSLDVLNDANLAALGEHAFGAGRGCGFFAYLLVGTGVGAGVVIDGKLFQGAHGAAGEVGYLPISGTGTGRPFALDSRGMLEDAASADAVVRGAIELGLADVSDAKQVFAAARAGDPLALAAVRQEAERLAHAVAAVAAVLDPELVVLGGGVGGNCDLLLEPLLEALALLTPLRPRIAASELSEDAVLMGAVATGLVVARERAFTERSAQLFPASG